MQQAAPIHAGRLVADCLHAYGVRDIFQVPGESFLAILDGLYDHPDMRVITCRHEGAAAMMAQAQGKLTGRPGVCLVTRGPGAANASAGVHVAFQDSTPMVLLVGQVARVQRDREAFQEVNLVDMFRPLAKAVEHVDDPERLPEYLHRAFQRAGSGRPGPVVLSLPEDVLSAQVDVPDSIAPPNQPGPCVPEDLSSITQTLSAAQRPLVIIGGPGWQSATAKALAEFALRNQLPVAASFRSQDYIDNEHPCYIGHLGLGVDATLAQAVKQADVVLCLGARLGEITSANYTLFESPYPSQKIIHVHPDANELGRVFHCHQALAMAVPPLVRQLATQDLSQQAAWSERTQALHRAYLQWNGSIQAADEQPLTAAAAQLLGTLLPENVVVANGAGNYAGRVHRYHRYRQYGGQLAPTSGSMGYGLPAAIAAKLTFPERPVVCFAGDGCLMMSVAEMATVIQYDLPILLIVANNGRYGTIVSHQERRFPGRAMGTGLRNPDFAALAVACGWRAQCVDDVATLRAQITHWQASEHPLLIELKQ